MTTTTSAPYPVRIRGELDQTLNPWLFLIKWLLLIPHIVALFFLTLVFVLTWIGSLGAIVFTGRYPRSLFDFNVGYLRWLWRVGFYSYEALGTDRYPPFSLAEDPSYPAGLEVDYPATLSKGLAFIKWWLLALPHYLVVVIFTGGLGERTGGLQLVLVLFAAIGQLFTGRYHPDLFVLVMGVNRWIYRVAGYALLTTDRYPPFRLEE